MIGLGLTEITFNKVISAGFEARSTDVLCRWPSSLLGSEPLFRSNTHF